MLNYIIILEWYWHVYATIQSTTIYHDIRQYIASYSNNMVNYETVVVYHIFLKCTKVYCISVSYRRLLCSGLFCGSFITIWTEHSDAVHSTSANVGSKSHISQRICSKRCWLVKMQVCFLCFRNVRDILHDMFYFMFACSVYVKLWRKHHGNT